MDTTMNRTKKYLGYFGKSFLKDKIAITMICLILFCVVGIIVVLAKGKKEEDNSSSE